MNENNITNSNIIGYKPDLEIYTRPYSQIENSDYQGLDYYNTREATKSNTVEEFELHLPNLKIEIIEEAKEQIKDNIERIREELCSHDIASKYVSSDNEEEKAQIIEENREDVETGTTRLEILVELEKIQKELEEVEKEFILCVYGSDVRLDEVKGIDEAYISAINRHEWNEEYEKINYFSLYYDTQISFLIGEYAERLLEAAIDMAVLNDEANNVSVDSSMKEMLVDKFMRVDKTLRSDQFKDSGSCDEIITALHNVFLAKNRYNVYLDTFGSVYKLSEGNDVISEISIEREMDLETKLDNLVKVTMYSPLCKNDITNVLHKKTELRGFFA